MSVGHLRPISLRDEGAHRLVMLSSALSGFAELMWNSIEDGESLPSDTLHDWQALTEVLAREAVAISSVLDRARMEEPDDPEVAAAAAALIRKADRRRAKGGDDDARH